MLPETAAQWHAALNDLPSVLFILAVLFELVGDASRRDSLRATGFWMLVVGAAGAVLSVISGLMAEETIEHGGSVHLVMQRHETLAITFTVVFVILAAWRVWRRRTMGRRERPVYLTVATLGALGILWTAHVGGTIVYGYGGGIPTQVLEGALSERTLGHSHGPAEAEEEGEADADTADHVDPPGTPPHEHE
jgi:uncharacterized membrane protein